MSGLVCACWKLSKASASTGIDTLSSNSELLLALADLPISADIPFHTIVGDVENVGPPDATVHFTTDGSVPSPDSPVYLKPFTISAMAFSVSIPL